MSCQQIHKNGELRKQTPSLLDLNVFRKVGVVGFLSLALTSFQTNEVLGQDLADNLSKEAFQESVEEQLRSAGWDLPEIRSLMAVHGTMFYSDYLNGFHVSTTSRIIRLGSSPVARELAAEHPEVLLLLSDVVDPDALARAIKSSGGTREGRARIINLFLGYNTLDASRRLAASLAHRPDIFRRFVHEEGFVLIADLFVSASNLQKEEAFHRFAANVLSDSQLVGTGLRLELADALRRQRPNLITYLANNAEGEDRLYRAWRIARREIIARSRDASDDFPFSVSDVIGHPDWINLAFLNNGAALFSLPHLTPMETAVLLFGVPAQLRDTNTPDEISRPLRVAEVNSASRLLLALDGDDLHLATWALIEFRNNSEFFNLVERTELRPSLIVCALKEVYAASQSPRGERAALEKLQETNLLSQAALDEMCNHSVPMVVEWIPLYSFYSIARAYSFGLEPDPVDWVGAGLDVLTLGIPVAGVARAGTSTLKTVGRRELLEGTISSVTRESIESGGRLAALRVTAAADEWAVATMRTLGPNDFVDITSRFRVQTAGLVGGDGRGDLLSRLGLRLGLDGNGWLVIIPGEDAASVFVNRYAQETTENVAFGSLVRGTANFWAVVPSAEEIE